MPPAPKGLPALLAQAQSADPLDRIGYRDQIAAYGPRAILAISPWLEDARLGAFAVRVITVVADAGYVEDAAAALVAARPKITNPDVQGDVDLLLARIVPKPAPRARRAAGFEVLDPKATLENRPAVRYRISAHKQRGHFNVPRAIMDQLAIPTDGSVVIEIRRAETGGLVYAGRAGLASGTEVYPTTGDPAMAELAALVPNEVIDVTVARDL